MKNRPLSLNSILKLLIIFSVIVLIEDIASVYDPAVSEWVTVILHSVRIVCVILFLRWHGLSFRKLLNIKNSDLFLMFHCFGMGIMIMFLGSCIESTMTYFLPASQSDSVYSTGYLLFAAVYAATIAPVFEEIEYRALLFTGIMKETNKLIYAVVISSMLFMIIHTGGITYGALILGIVSAITYYKTKKIIYSIMMHLSGNLLGSILILLSIGSNSSEVVEETMSKSDILINVIINTVFGTCWLAGLIAGIAIILYRVKKRLSDNIIAEVEERIITVRAKRQSILLAFIYIVICGMSWYILY